METKLDKIFKILNVRYHNGEKYSVSFLDYKYDSEDNVEFIKDKNNIAKVYLKLDIVNGVLESDIKDFSYDKIFSLFKKKINDLLKNKKNKSPYPFFIKEKTVENDRKLITLLINLSNFIAITCRRGPANTVILNDKYYNIVKDFLPNMSFVIDNRLKNKIYIYRKNKIDEPGLTFVYDQKTGLFDIAVTGYVPENNFECLTIKTK